MKRFWDLYQTIAFIGLLSLVYLITPDTASAQAGGFMGCSSVTSIPQIECEALVALNNATNLSTQGWMSHSDPCFWADVVCSNGTVTKLTFTLSGLSGTIPPELGDLSNLQLLYLGGNFLTGPIPPELGNLTNLTQFYLDGNQLTGSIPPELGNLTNLTAFSVNNNQLSGAIPPELGNLTNLYFLLLGENQLSGTVPPELGNLINLDTLDLYNNPDLVGSLPAGLINLQNLFSFSYFNTDLCVIENDANLMWLASIDTVNPTVPNTPFCPPLAVELNQLEQAHDTASTAAIIMMVSLALAMGSTAVLRTD